MRWREAARGIRVGVLVVVALAVVAAVVGAGWYLIGDGATGAAIIAISGLAITFIALVLALVAWLRPRAPRGRNAECKVQRDVRATPHEDRVQGLTRLLLARELWGDPAHDPAFSPMRRWTLKLDDVAATDPVVGEVLAHVRGEVPDYRPTGYVSEIGALSQRDWWVGLQRVTLDLQIVVVNSGDLPGRVTLRFPQDAFRLSSRQLRSAGGWVDGQLSSEDGGTREVAAKGSCQFTCRLWLACGADGDSWADRFERVVRLASLGQVFAAFLRRPVEKVPVRWDFNGGPDRTSHVTVRTGDPQTKFAINELDVDVLRKGLPALRAAVDPNDV